MRKPAFYTSSSAMGDILSATPTVRKLSEIYKCQITVISKYPRLFENLPYVDESLNFSNYSEKELNEKYELHKTFFLLGKRDPLGIEFKHAICDIRQYHAKDLGFMLAPNEMSCDFNPKENIDCINKFNLPEKYVVIHPSQSWPSRTWSRYNWQSLCMLLEDINIPVVLIGKDTIEFKNGNNFSKPIFKINNKNVIDLSNKCSLDQTWYILNNSKCIITMDSGILHLAGTTDSYIIQLGSSIKPEFRAPYRKGTQEYKYKYIIGKCKLHCASDLKHSLKEWGSIQNVPLIDTCLEGKSTFECNPNFKEVFNHIKEIWDKEFNENKSIIENEENINDETLIEIQSGALGDTIGAMAVIEEYRKKTNKKISVICNNDNIFKKSYPEINFYNSESNFEYISNKNLWKINDKCFKEKISTKYKFEVPLLRGFANDFGIEDLSNIKIKVDNPNKPRPIKNKYVCFGIQSTSQCKYWNCPGGWDELAKYFRKKNITPVCVEKYESFGIPNYFNTLPAKAFKKVGMPFDDVLNYISHAELFIGISSGLSWVAQGLGVPTVIISNATSKDNEFVDEKTLRIYDESVCHGCFHKYNFDPSDWLWCPVYRNDENKRFICTKAITPEIVIEKIENFMNL